MDVYEYINRTYNKSFKVGMLVRTTDGKIGVIQKTSRGQYVAIKQSDNKFHYYHPNDVVEIK